MSDIAIGIEQSLFRLDIDGGIALCFALAGLLANVAAAAVGVVIV